MIINATSIFKKNLKRLKKKHYPVNVIKPCLNAIINNNTNVCNKIKDHKLSGKWKDYREFHPSRYSNYGSNFDNWIIIYKINNNELILTLVNTGNHQILK
ncbi:type II toxin-antitoxin system mRNA interferase toxin, RelE/StbE family [Apilactobacillus micheneri]|uniref:Type II toxin-antitoxin system mRNA interferase toxin, RelE/StbE family n=1 Tax=Apilactobacillus micheneri TaxID=1899430 RepID=A0ABY2YYZ0_9LACO|nr:type II toxin-antitoxin system mRNA interferase toxin, RelE/StbE family [Apilactobacillus micheneri]TPR26155.1 type II toxin-antitoxin system mRNA interferase toxin, RelE/StbE family [Apilactobacillus micheneri]TPR26909.1 type II toxin-antitoxin system mRNA interferase toxin, RelE/StbE family [Apilactobacillus micheneri]TPR27767.1 type II toxin-antitoxin system mRNA interferase toxin, RelE/StbE family [Apilactobacillus micheneri]TPR31672.1 type II toxin-antitoxin system mRNA interferase toxi